MAGRVLKAVIRIKYVDDVRLKKPVKNRAIRWVYRFRVLALLRTWCNCRHRSESAANGIWEIRTYRRKHAWTNDRGITSGVVGYRNATLRNSFTGLNQIGHYEMHSGAKIFLCVGFVRHALCGMLRLH